MIKIIVTCDNNADSLGDYFLKCRQDIALFFQQEPNIQAFYCDGSRCNQAFIDFEVQKINKNPFIFVAYSHGVEDALVQNGNIPYVKIGVNSQLFLNSLFITNACLVEKKLGKELITNGVKAFVGFDVEAKVVFANEALFVRMDNYFLQLFLSKEITFIEALKALINEYTRQIDEWAEMGNAIDVSTGHTMAAFSAIKASLKRLYNLQKNNNLTHKDFDT